MASEISPAIVVRVEFCLVQKTGEGNWRYKVVRCSPENEFLNLALHGYITNGWVIADQREEVKISGGV